MSGPLSGIRVVDFSRVLAGPLCARTLLDLGAEVIKIEPPRPDVSRFAFPSTPGMSGYYAQQNAGKRNVSIDLNVHGARELALQLCDTADVVVENFRAGTLRYFGLDYETLAARNPRLIYASITGFGPSGPYAQRAGYDTVGQAMSGLLSVLTDLSNPQPMGISLSDHLTGMMAAYGILGALMARERTGRGQRVDTSLLSATVAFLGENAARLFETGKKPSRATRTHSAQVYAFLDANRKGFVVHLSSPTKFWRGLTEVAGHPEWQDDPRFSAKRDRQLNYDVLHGLLAAVFQTRDRDHWLALLLAQDVPSAPIYTLDEVFDDPQVKHLGLKREVPHPKLGQVSLVGGGVSLSATPVEIRSVAPDYGQHTDEILRRIGRGMSKDGTT